MRNDECELVIRIGRGLNSSAPDILREFTMQPCLDKQPIPGQGALFPKGDE